MTKPMNTQRNTQPISPSHKRLAEMDLILGARLIPTPPPPLTRSEPDINNATAQDESSNMATTKKKRKSPAKIARLKELQERHAAECPLCTTMPGINKLVFGEGEPNADLMFIGEAPGAEEDKTGRPFVGRAGNLLEKMIVAIGLSREDVFIANILKSRPPNNATPTPAQVAQCSPYLVEQIEIIKPRVIVTLGAPSTKFVLQTKLGISKLRGEWHPAAIPGLNFKVEVMPTFHPAYLLRVYTTENRKKVWTDLQKAVKRLDK